MPNFNLLPNMLYEVGARWLFGSSRQSWYYAWYVTTPTLPAGVSTADALANSAWHIYVDELVGFLGSGILFDAYSVREFNVTTGFTGREYEAFFAYTTPGPGSCLPPAVCVLAQLATNVVGRTGRGRIFVSGVAARFTTDGTVDPVWRASLQTKLNRVATLRPYVLAPGTVPIADRVLKRSVPGGNLGPPFAPARVVGARLDPILRQQRRRVPR